MALFLSETGNFLLLTLYLGVQLTKFNSAGERKADCVKFMCCCVAIFARSRCKMETPLYRHPDGDDQRREVLSVCMMVFRRI